MESLNARRNLNPLPEMPEAAAPLAEIFRREGVRTTFARNAGIYAEEADAASVFLVVSGTVRICKYCCDGKRQISAFHMAGEVFGFEPGEEHRFDAEAVENCVLLAIRRSALVAQAAEDANLAQALWHLCARELQRAQEHMLLLGRQSAMERILSFLDSVAERRGDPTCVQLPMGRQDIADHLGLTIETVSRTMTQLAEAQAIVVEGIRRIRLGQTPSRLAA